MSLPTLKNNYFLVYIQDLPNAQRDKHTEAHMAYNAPRIQNGTIRLGGGLLPPEAKSTDADALTKIVGSFIIVQADSIEAAWDGIKKDVFYSSGEVWDREKIYITPAFIATPEAKFD